MKPFSRELSHFSTTDKITDRDRTNVDVWAKIYDRDPYFQAMTPQRSQFSVGQDTALLTAAGFQCGFSGQSWFGRDKSGYLWRVSSRSEWSRNKERSPVLPDRWEAPVGTMTLAWFREIFDHRSAKNRN